MSSVFISNVDDYLAPSQACVNPIFVGGNDKTDDDDTETKDKSGNATTTAATAARVIPSQRRPRRKRRIVQRRAEAAAAAEPSIMESTTTTTAATTPTTTRTNDGSNNNNNNHHKIAKVTMADCLACSGCITTAETVLVQQHSLDRFLHGVKKETTCHSSSSAPSSVEQQRSKPRSVTRIMTISPASWADLRRKLDVETNVCNNDKESQSPLLWNSLDLWRRLTCFLHDKCRISMVVDGRLPLQWSLQEAAHEFCHKYTQQQQRRKQQKVKVSTLRPLLSSSCPALVCLVEKSVESAVPHLATTMSAMSMAGVFLKQGLGRQRREGLDKNNNNNNSVYHVAVMPCHDKKLEASRREFQNHADNDKEQQQQQQQPLVDLVLTTRELWTLLCQEAAAAGFGGKSSVMDAASVSNKNVLAFLHTFSLASLSTRLPTTDYSCHDAEVPPTLVVPPSSIVDHCCTTATATASTSAASNNDDGNDDVDMVDANKHDDDKNNNNHNHADGNDVWMQQQEQRPEQKEQQQQPAFFPLGSGGYADYIFRYACRQLFGHIVDNGEELPWMPVEGNSSSSSSSNSSSNTTGTMATLAKRTVVSARVAASAKKRRDYHQVVLYRHADGSYSCTPWSSSEQSCSSSSSLQHQQQSSSVPVLRFATAYGLQNIQRVLQSAPFASKASSSSSSSNVLPFDYVEAMACPSGCPNGGGQIREANVRETPSETRQRVMETTQVMKSMIASENYGSNTSLQGTTTTPSSQAALDYPIDLCPTGPFGQDAKRLLHTQFHVVPPLQHTMGAAAGVAVQDIQW